MTFLDDCITILQRVKNCDKALGNLEMASKNIIFQKEIHDLDPEKTKYLNHVKFLIDEAIQIIENKQN